MLSLFLFLISSFLLLSLLQQRNFCALQSSLSLSSLSLPFLSLSVHHFLANYILELGACYALIESMVHRYDAWFFPPHEKGDR